MVAPTNGGSRVRLRPKTSPADLQGSDDDVVVVDSIRRSSRKRKSESVQSSPRPRKRQTVWVEVPPRRIRALSLAVKREPLSPEAAIEGESSTLTLKQEPDREASNALSALRNVSPSFPPPPQSFIECNRPCLQTKLKTDKKSLDDISVFTRLSKIGLEVFPVTIEAKVKELSVSRPGVLSKNFGGSPMGVHPKISPKNLQNHGFDNFMYVTLVSERTETVNDNPRILTAFTSRFIRMRRRFQGHQVSGCPPVIAIAQGRTCG